MFTGPVGPVEVFFYWPETVFGNFYWPGAIGSPLASSPGVLADIWKQVVQIEVSYCFVCLTKVTLQLLHLLSSKKSHFQQILT